MPINAPPSWVSEVLDSAPKRIAPAPYVAAEPDGPVGRFEAEFAIGASWSHDPGPDYDPIDRPAKRDRPA